MAPGPQFNLDHDVTYGTVDQITPLVQRVTCENPSKFTFTGTGTYIVGDEEVAIIDPGPPEDAHVDALLAAIDGRTVTHLLITHTHGDHSPAAGLLQHHIDAPTYAFGPHPLDRPDPKASNDANNDDAGFGFDPIEEDETEANNDEDDGYKSEHAHDWDFAPDVTVAHGDIIQGTGFSFEALHTPGHISNHLCFALREEQSVFSGDHVMGWSTTIIPPPDGSLNSYLASLRLLLPRSEQTYYPTHGAPITDPATLLPALLAHREARTGQILACMSDGIDTIKEMVLRMYTHVPPQLYNAAAASVMSHLVALHEIDEISCSDAKPKPRSLYNLAG
ncbi:MAG: MBL fold metallo-hydrolase [Acidimicrobiales bacterium]|jgi:glyoxylase-like metal-dependent hydrolase (beta-lactamase superfamily II)